MPYTAPTLAQAQADLASRLNDSAFVHWTAAELARYLREAIRTWSAWTACYRDTGTFDLGMGQADTYHDLPTVLPTLRGYSVTNWDLVTDLQYALLEPPAAGGTWTGTDQFTLAQLSAAIQRRRDQFLRDTGAVGTIDLDVPFAATANGRYTFDEDVLIVRQVTWTPNSNGLPLQLMRTDEWAANNFAPAWLTPSDFPLGYSTSVTPPLELQILPPPLGDGTLGLLTVNKGAAVDPLVSSLLGIPDDWTWVVKYGALADLLQGDGLALDAPRAQYCQARWAEGIDMAKKAPVVLTGRINNTTVRLASLSEATTYSPLWAAVTGPPKTLLLSSQNLIASWPPPGGGGPYTARLDVVRNAPVPVAGGDILQVDQGTYDSLLDYAQHLALFKEGPGQLELASALLQRAAASAGVSLQIQQASQPSRAPLLTQTQQDEHASSRESDVVPVD